jgi:TM2 domain-containing membrane protein YozV
MDDQTFPSGTTPPSGFGAAFSQQQLEQAKSKRVAAGVLGILLGAFGIHKFILGYTAAALIMLIASLAGLVLGWCLCVPAIAPSVMGIIGLIEGILYLTKTDEEFMRTYILQRRSWF